jgi:hypothetical protein
LLASACRRKLVHSAAPPFQIKTSVLIWWGGFATRCEGILAFAYLILKIPAGSGVLTAGLFSVLD